MTGAALLDTDILSALMRGIPSVVAKARAYLAEQERLRFSVITRYEILRGLKAKDASTQIDAFARFCETSDVLPLTDEIVDVAADTYARLYAAGRLVGDADILIAATALVHRLAVVTNNESHFRRIPGLDVENWLAA